MQAICSVLNWPCLDESIHTRTTVQHANYDERAACGSGKSESDSRHLAGQIHPTSVILIHPTHQPAPGCSGNPWDAEWNVGFGWGDAHELGHNMQIAQLNIFYPPPGTGNRNMWTTLQNRAGENSNKYVFRPHCPPIHAHHLHSLIIARLSHAHSRDSVFPYAVMWNFYRNYHNYTGAINDDHMVGKVRTCFPCVGARKESGEPESTHAPRSSTRTRTRTLHTRSIPTGRVRGATGRVLGPPPGFGPNR